MKNILISGLSGFVGSNLKNYLNPDQYTIKGLSRHQGPSNESNNISWNEISQVKNLELDAIIHLAGLAHDLKGSNHDDEYLSVNKQLTISLFDIFLQSKAESFIYLSSVKAVADQVEGMLTEDANPAPMTAYGKSKLKAENYILQHGIHSTKRCIILRPCMIHGIGNKGNLNRLFRYVRRGLPYPLSVIDNKRSFLSMQNLSFAIKHIIDDIHFPSGVYNIADDEAISTREVVRIAYESLGLRPRFINIPHSILKTIASIGDKIPFLLDSDKLNKLTGNYIVDNQKIKKALHIKHFPVATNDGIRLTFNSFNFPASKG